MPLTPILFGFLIAACIISLASFLRFSDSRIRKRLEVQTKPGRRPTRADDTPAVLPPALVEKFEKKLGIKKDGAQAKELKKQLVQAGIYSDRALTIFLGLKIGLPLALPILIMPLLWGRGINKLMLMGIGYVLFVGGYFLPTLILRQMVDSRQKKIQQALPDALDLLVVCVEAGQGLNAALKRVSDDFMVSCPALAKELNLVNLEINAGLEREQALRNLADRTGVEEVASLCSILIQSDRFGTSVATALKVQSETLRTTRRQKLEELAAKTPVKLIFPLLLFIFPAIMVVILGPAVIRIMESIMKR
ncbi:MAG: type II secretion system F family protein [Syntrophales bacterium]|nr:type II secretion system F family protein [Syntrophales bacterium]MDD5643548.1 type II secretion system F family protein [Syntrophales bacterium]